MTIELHNITKLYGTQRALDNVSLSIDKGEITGLLGPNGAGKSTMMKIICCYLPPSEGTASVYGFDVMEEPMKVKSRIGYLPEHNPLYTDMYVREYLKYIAGIFKIRNDIEERINEVIDLTGLQVEQNKKIGALSKGFRQRVGLAQALIHDPDVLILDEPTTGLDPNQLLEIRELIKKIGKEKTVLLSTHIMQEVDAICDRVLIINEGKLVADKATSEISQLLQSSEIISVEFDKSIKSSDLKKIDGIQHVLEVNSKLFEITGREGTNIRKTLFNWAVNSDVQIVNMNKKDSNLEHVFRQLTQKKK